MSIAFRRGARLALAVVGATSVALVGTSGSIAQASGGNAPYWGTAAALDSAGPGLLTAAACPGTITCVGVGASQLSGSGSYALPEVVAEGNGVWGTSQIVALTGGSTPDAAYLSVACMSASSCVGVGDNSDTGYEAIAGPIALSGTAVTANPAAVLTLPSSPASASPEDAALSSVSCTTSTCTAVGYYETSTNKLEPMVATMGSSGEWNTATVAAPAAAAEGANLTAVSCASSDVCEAVGNYVDGSGDVQNWAVQLGGGTPHTLTLPPGAVAGTGPLPPSPAILNSQGYEVMAAISCPNSGDCTAIAQYPVSGGSMASASFSIDNGTPAAGVELPGASGLAYTQINSIWCSDGSDCVGDGVIITSGGGSTLVFAAVTAYEAAGVWSTDANLPGTAPSSSPIEVTLGIGCNAVDRCLAVGLQTNGSLQSFEPLVDFSASQLSVSTSSLPAATAGVPYSATLEGAGGAGASTWSINGSLPAGLTLNTATGVISGTPTTPGTDSFTAQLASAGPPSQAASVDLTIAVAAAPVAAQPAPPAAPAAAPKLSFGSAKVTPSGVTLALGCSGSGTCSGKAVVTAVEHLTGKRITAVTARAKKRKVTITLARGSYSLTAGQLGTINLKLTAQAKALLRKLHTIKGRLTLTPTGASQPALTRTVTFKSAKKKK